jgi:SAM-dependent methyltransferase
LSFKSVSQTLAEIATTFSPESVLDVGCGQGRYSSLLRRHFPKARITGVDFSPVAVEKASKQHPDISFRVGGAEALDFVDDHSVDFILNIEVLEHVDDVRKMIAEFKRVLRTGGRLLLTTPCANRWSLEWCENIGLHGSLRDAADGFQIFHTDPPEHVRRLTSNQLAGLLGEYGLQIDSIRFRGHLFTRPAYLSYQRVRSCFRVFAELAMLDWRLLRRFQNGATMIAVATRR